MGFDPRYNECRAYSEKQNCDGKSLELSGNDHLSLLRIEKNFKL